MSGRRQIGIILFCLLFCTAQAQSSRPIFTAALDSMIVARGATPRLTSIIADSAYRLIVKERQVTDPSGIVIVNNWTLGNAGTNQQVVTVSGLFIGLKPPKAAEPFSISRRFPLNIEQVDDKGFWDSVLQPALVTLGAVTIIALFFLVRS